MSVLLVGQRRTGWQPVSLGSGGQLTSIDIAPDLTTVVCYDTHGAAVWEPTAYAPGYPGGRGKWRNLVNKTTIPDATIPFSALAGGYAIRVAPSNSQRFYLYLSDGYFYRTDDRCATPWVRTNFTQRIAYGDRDTKFVRNKMAVDPVNADVVFTGTPANGGFFTVDAGENWSAVPTVAAATAYYGSDSGQSGGTNNLAGNLFIFDATSATSGSPARTQGLYAASYGVGVYHSVDGGATWTLLNSTGMPTLPTQMQVDSAGKLWVADDHLNVYDPGTDTWSKFADATLFNGGGSGSKIRWFVVCPTDTNKIFCGDNASWWYTPNGGSSWTNNRMSGAPTKTSNDHPYLKRSTATTVGNVVWGTDNILRMAEGTGVWTITEAALNASHNFTKPPMTSMSAGIENLVVNWIISPPGKNPLFACMDRPFFALPDVRTFPADYGPNYSGADIKEGFSVDWASSDPNFLVGLVTEGFVAYGTPYIATSRDGGRTPTWTTIAKPSGLYSSGGCVAALTPLNWVWVEANAQVGNVGSSSGGRLWYTTDGGQNFSQSTVSIGFDNGWYLQNALNSLRRQMVCADRVNGKFYYYNSGTVAPGFYISADGGANLSLACAGKTDTNGPSNFNFQMRAVPPHSGYSGGRFFATSGKNDDDSIISNPFYSCVDNGDGTITKTAVTGVINVWAFGFGKPDPNGSGVPTIFIKGSVGSAQDIAGVGGYGIWRSNDFGTSWTKLSDLFPGGSLDRVHTVEGDSNIYGRCYVGFAGTGALMYDP